MFHKIDTQQWPRRELFYYFSHMAPTGYSITVDYFPTSGVENAIFGQ